MFAYLPALAALLALTSSVHHVHADAGKEPFAFDIEITFDDPDAAKISDSDKKIISDAVVKSFNSVHDTEVIELYKFDMKKFDVNPSGSYLSQLLPNGLTGSGSTYTYGRGSGGNCRACSSDDKLESTDLAYTHDKWQTALTELIDNSGSAALAKASNVAIKVDGESVTLYEPDVQDGKEDFTFDVEITFDDPAAAKISDSDKKIISDAVVKSFNDAHNTDIIELYSFDIKKFDVNPDSSYLAQLLPSYVTGSGSTYTYGRGTGGNCRACNNDDMLEYADLTYTHNKWQADLKKILDNSGSDALAQASNVVIKVNGEKSYLSDVETRDDSKVDFAFDIEVTFSDPDATKIGDSDKKAISDCIVSSFNEVHDTSVIELYKFDMKKFEVSDNAVLSLLRGAPTPLTGSGSTYTYGRGSGGNCRACSSDDLLVGADMIKYTHSKWQKTCNECLVSSGSALKKSSNVLIKISGVDETEQFY